MQVFIINPGATSTKLAVFDGEREVFKQTIEHSAEDLAPFARVIDQLDYRKALILDALTQAGYTPRDFAAVCGRGGLMRHIPSGTYLVDAAVLSDLEACPFGEHASNLGAPLAQAIAEQGGVSAYFVDPVAVDELAPIARVSGLAGVKRQSFFHALNHKSMARRAAQELGKTYEQANLIVVHMGGGVSVAAHACGKTVDVYNVKDDGSFSIDRGGALPVGAIVELCFSGKSKAEVKKILGTGAGVFSYLGTRDFREVERRAFEQNDADARLVFDALAYQLSKDVGAMAAVLNFCVDAVVLTGGMAYSARLCDAICAHVGKLAPVLRQPGEAEMLALAQGALRVLGGETPKCYQTEVL